MAKDELVEVVYVGPKTFSCPSGHGESRKVVLHKPGEMFKVPSSTYTHMKDVLKPRNVFDAEALAIVAAKEALDASEAAVKAATGVSVKPASANKGKGSNGG